MCVASGSNGEAKAARRDQKLSSSLWASRASLVLWKRTSDNRQCRCLGPPQKGSVLDAREGFDHSARRGPDRRPGRAATGSYRGRLASPVSRRAGIVSLRASYGTNMLTSFLRVEIRFLPTRQRRVRDDLTFAQTTPYRYSENELVS